MRDDRMMDIIIGIAESLTLHYAKADFSHGTFCTLHAPFFTF
jgi:hypothetical protein